MIEQITIKNFKSFKDVTLKLGPLNIFIGANASGKSNFFDALRVLQGIGYGFTLSRSWTASRRAPQAKSGKASAAAVQVPRLTSRMRTQPTSFQVTGKLPSEADSDFEFTIAFLASEGTSARRSRLSRLEDRSSTIFGMNIVTSTVSRVL